MTSARWCRPSRREVLLHDGVEAVLDPVSTVRGGEGDVGVQRFVVDVAAAGEDSLGAKRQQIFGVVDVEPRLEWLDPGVLGDNEASESSR